LSPMQIWCNEAQERYVLGLRPADVAAFTAICERERCPFAVVGEVTEEQRLVVSDTELSLLPPGEGGAQRRMRVGSFIDVGAEPDPHPYPSPDGRGV